jgi:hypothetical protein
MCSPGTRRTSARRPASYEFQKRLTIDQLADRLALPRTTIYYWVKDLPHPAHDAG